MKIREMYVFQLSFEKQKLLSEIMDPDESWEDLAAEIRISGAVVYKLKENGRKGKSPTQEVILGWGAKGYTVEQLFRTLAKYKHYRAMKVLLKDVPESCHALFNKIKPELGTSTSGKGQVRSVEKMEPSCPNSFPSRSMSSNQGNPCSHQSHQQPSKGMCSKHGQQTSGSVASTSDTAAAVVGLNNTLTVPYEELRSATGDFAQENVIGKGGYGVVYKATWKHTDIAVKRILPRKLSAVAGNQKDLEEDNEQLRQSLKELRALALYRHDNILPLYGYSLEGPEPCLVYQFMANGSLEDRLQCRNETSPLDWECRKRVVSGAAKGLHFLHTVNVDEKGRPKPLIHGDVKSANILLDAHFQPKLGDFGLCRSGQVEVPAGGPPLIASHIRGTLAYLPPEFIHKKHLSYHLDIYSFGVVLYEIATGLRAYSELRRPDSKLVDFMGRKIDHNPALLEVGNPEEILTELSDPKAGSLDMDLFGTLLKLGYLCTQKDPIDRCTSTEILNTLSKL